MNVASYAWEPHKCIVIAISVLSFFVHTKLQPMHVKLYKYKSSPKFNEGKRTEILNKITREFTVPPKSEKDEELRSRRKQ